MVAKAATAKIPIVASVAAAIDSGIAIAKRVNLTLVGFVRGTHMNVYTRPERIIL
jgi:FdhD protein